MYKYNINEMFYIYCTKLLNIIEITSIYFPKQKSIVFLIFNIPIWMRFWMAPNWNNYCHCKLLRNILVHFIYLLFYFPNIISLLYFLDFILKRIYFSYILKSYRHVVFQRPLRAFLFIVIKLEVFSYIYIFCL